MCSFFIKMSSVCIDIFGSDSLCLSRDHLSSLVLLSEDHVSMHSFSLSPLSLQLLTRADIFLTGHFGAAGDEGVEFNAQVLAFLAGTLNPSQ